MAVFKFVLAVLFLPVVYASAVSFREHLSFFPSMYEDIFVWGLGIFLLTFFFVYQYGGIYDYGQKFSRELFKMFAPFDRIVSYIFPVYTVFVCVLFFVVKNFLRVDAYNNYFLFFIGFSITMHLLLTAQTLQEEDRAPVKPHYLLTMAFVFVVNMMMLVVSLDVINLKVTFPKYFSLLAENVADIYMSVINLVGR